MFPNERVSRKALMILWRVPDVRTTRRIARRGEHISCEAYRINPQCCSELRRHRDATISQQSSVSSLNEGSFRQGEPRDIHKGNVFSNRLVHPKRETLQTNPTHKKTPRLPAVATWGAILRKGTGIRTCVLSAEPTNMDWWRTERTKRLM